MSLIRYGVKDISIKGDDKIFISLSYSPKEKTLKKKFGNLPLRYMRTKLENEHEFAILERVVKRYKFNLVDDDTVEELDALPQPKKRYLEPPSKYNTVDDDNNIVEELEEALLQPRKRYLEAPTFQDDDDNMDEYEQNMSGTSSKRRKNNDNDYL